MGKILIPFSIIKKELSSIIIWTLFIIGFSNLGIIFSVFDCANKGINIKDIFRDSFQSCAFYLNRMALLASYLGYIFIEFITQKKIQNF